MFKKSDSIAGFALLWQLQPFTAFRKNNYSELMWKEKTYTHSRFFSWGQNSMKGEAVGMGWLIADPKNNQ